MHQYRITSDNIPQTSEDDCYLAPTDPIHELKAKAIMGGLGGQERLAAYKSTLKQPIIGSNKGQIQRGQNIKPGTEAWFRLWFGRSDK